jgi:hypothetical protein
MSDPQSITVYDPATGKPMATFSSADATTTCDLYEEFMRRTSMVAALEAMTDDGASGE